MKQAEDRLRLLIFDTAKPRQLERRDSENHRLAAADDRLDRSRGGG